MDATQLEQVESLLSHLAEQIGSAPLTLNDEGCVWLESRKEADLRLGLLLDQNGKLCWVSPLAPLPERGREELYEFLLHLNTSHVHTCSMSVSLHPVEPTILTIYAEELDALDPETFINTTVNFLTNSKALQATILEKLSTLCADIDLEELEVEDLGEAYRA